MNCYHHTPRSRPMIILFKDVESLTLNEKENLHVQHLSGREFTSYQAHSSPRMLDNLPFPSTLVMNNTRVCLLEHLRLRI